VPIVYKLLFDSRQKDEMTHKAITIARELRENGIPIEIIDTANWDEEEKLQFYQNELIPLSLKTHKRLRGHVRTHKSKTLMYHLVLITENNFYARDEAIRKLIELKTYVNKPLYFGKY